MADAYHADASWRAKLRRRAVRLAARRPARAPRRPMVSFAFDDVPASAAREGAAILEARGLKGTFYVAAALAGADAVTGPMALAEDARRLAAAGHEIGCHTFSHQYGTGVASAVLESDTTRNQAFIAEVLGDYRLSSFAYPYGDVSPRTKRLFGRRFATSRGIRRGVNGDLIDLAQLKAIGLEHQAWRPERIERAVETAARSNGWIIFFTHDVSETPSRFGATPEMLDHALACVRAAGIDILPVKHALARAAFQ